MGRHGKIPELTNKEDKISQIIYDSLGYMYCDNCRYNNEFNREMAIKDEDYDPCDDCHRKYNGWAVSKETCDDITRKISKLEHSFK